MRSEKEMLELILHTAREDERIRAVIMNGSRTNLDAPRDPFQDFDIVYIVTEMTPFVKKLEWIRRFGEVMVMQMPEAMDDPPPSNDGGFGYLMQFMDGNRIDLGIYPLEKLDEHLSDSLSLLLLDKDGRIPPFPQPSDRSYLPKPPSAEAFANCCNEFWWVSPYVAKGLWREEITYAKQAMDVYVRDMLMKMLVWQIGVKTQFLKSPGKDGKYFKRYLDADLWEMLLKTYAGAGYEPTWEALFTMCDLFRIAALQVAAYFGYEYPHGDDERVSAHLRHVRALPPDAKEIY
jgi:aminoglycoside 6-adenylyltransferase